MNHYRRVKTSSESELMVRNLFVSICFGPHKYTSFQVVYDPQTVTLGDQTTVRSNWNKNGNSLYFKIRNILPVKNAENLFGYNINFLIDTKYLKCLHGVINDNIEGNPDLLNKWLL